MGPPVSAVIADLVMGNIEDRTLSTSPVAPRWWRRYVDNSNVCLKETDVIVFHEHRKSIDSNIQFTIESVSMVRQKDKGRSIFFLDSQVTVLSDGSIEIDAFRKKTHTDKYLDFTSHNPMQHKEAVVKTHINRANLLPSLPYVKGASDLVGLVLQKFRIGTAFKPVRTSGHIFRKPKNRPAVNRMAGIVYKVDVK